MLHAEILNYDMLERFRDIKLRDADQAECVAGGLTPFDAISVSVDNSWESYAVYAGSELLAVWGYYQTSVMGEGCGLWLLSTEGVNNHPISFARESWRIIHSQLGSYPVLFCYVHAEHEQALAWLKWLGFSIHTSEEDFYIMALRRV